MEGPIEWGQFKTDHFDILIDEDAPFVEARHMIYDGMDHPLSEIVHEGPLLRFEKGGIMFKKPGWREAYFVLTAAGYLHGFPNAPVVSVDVVAGEFVQPVEDVEDENESAVVKDEPAAPVSIAAWMVGGKKKPARKRRDTVYYDSVTAKFKVHEDEEEKAKNKNDQMDDLQPEMVKNQAEALFRQLSDGALDRGEPDLCLYLPECVIAPLGIPVDGKGASGWTTIEFEIQHKGRSNAGAFTRTGEKYRLKALSQDQAEFWWDLISTMTKSNGDEGIIAFKNLATSQAQDVTLMTPGSTHPATPTGMPKLSTIRPPSFHFRNAAAPHTDLPMSPSRSITGGESTTLWTSSDMASLPRANNVPTRRPTSSHSHGGQLQTLRESHGDDYADVMVDNHPVPNADDDTDRSDDEDVLRARRRSLTAMGSPYGTALWKNNWNTNAGAIASGAASTSFNSQRRASSASIESSATTVSEEVGINARTSPVRTPGRDIEVPRSEGSPVYANGGESSTSTSRTMAYSEDLLQNDTPVPISPMLHKSAPTPPPTPHANHGHIGSPIAYYAQVSTNPAGGVDLMQAVLKAKAQRTHTGSPALNEEYHSSSPARGNHHPPTPLGATPTNAGWISAAEAVLEESEELLGKQQSASPVASSPQRLASAAPLPQGQFAWTPSAQSAFASIGADLQSDPEDSDRGAIRARGPQSASSKLVGLPAAYQRHDDDDSDDDRMNAPSNLAAVDEYQSNAPVTPRLFTISDSARRGSGPEVRTMYSPVVESRSPFAAYRDSTPTEDDKTEIAASVGGRRISSGVYDTTATAAATNAQQDRWGATAEDDNGDFEQMLEDLTRSLSPTSAAESSVGFRASYNDVSRRSALQLVKEEDEDEENILSPRGDADGMLSPVSPMQPDLLLSAGEGEEKKERKHREHRSKDKDRERHKKDEDGEKSSRREKSSKRGDENDEVRARRRKERKEREKLEKAAVGAVEEDEEEKARRRKERKERKEREEREGGGGEDKEKKERKKDKERKKEREGSGDPEEEARRRERRERKMAEKAER
ncbi:hypothetical protein BJ742DRAFT_14615 [Cladochytrium replicatum]|nr:hypothetical protein BJ742DRAFT_14615 [Cladochytrium replicatum]